MAFYDLSKEDRNILVSKIKSEILEDLKNDHYEKSILYFGDNDTYIRKAAYLSLGKIYFENRKLQIGIIKLLKKLYQQEDPKIRQTVINSAGEIGKKDFDKVQYFFDVALFDNHHSVRNAVIGSLKKMIEVNPEPLLKWAKKFLHNSDDEVRREIVHGIELRGRKYPQEILPLLKELQNDKSLKVRKMIVHVIGQISYKKDCLQIVIDSLNNWENKEIVAKAIDEIINIHYEYKDFSELTPEQAIQYILENFNNR